MRCARGVAEADLPAAEIDLLGPTGAERIDTLVRDIVSISRERGDVAQSDEVGGAMLRLRKFMFERVYLGPEARSEHDRVLRTLRGLFDHYLDDPGSGRRLAPRRPTTCSGSPTTSRV